MRILLLFSLFFLPWQVMGSDDFTAICYHDVKSTIQGDLDGDQFAISSDNLMAEFEWLKVNGFQPVSIEDLVQAKKGVKPLPAKAVLLTFDDGLLSFYTKIYPLLRLYNYPAVFALVGSWLESSKEIVVEYGNTQIQRRDFLTWRQLKEMQESGLIEIASHSYALHVGIDGNPQGNKQPAAVTRIYRESGRYETDSEYRARIKEDLRKNSALIKQHLGKQPRVMVWPYGAHSKETIEIAASLGLSINLTLEEDKPNSIGDLTRIHRKLIMANPQTSDFAYMLYQERESEPERMVHIDLDYVYDPDPLQQEQNLSLLVERVSRLNINRVYLQAFADPDGDGDVDSLYFPNRHLPMRADLFNRVAWQLRTRAGVKVYAWMPVLAFYFGEEIYSKLGVKEYRDGRIQNATASYKRLSPFNKEVRSIINEIYTDLAKNSKFYGLLFHDDAYLTDFEDFSDAALLWYASKGIEQTAAEIREDPVLIKRLAELKTDYLIDFTRELSDTVRFYQPDIKTARNMYALPVIQPESEQWFAQNLEKFVEHYDTTAIMAMPYMEKATDPEKWLQQLVAEVKKRIPPYTITLRDKANFSKVLFELQAMDWEKKKYLKSEVLVSHIRLLLEANVNNIGYYPDNFLENQPDLETIKTIFSLQTFPFNRQ